MYNINIEYKIFLQAHPIIKSVLIFDNAQMSERYIHPLTGQKHESLDQIFAGWSELTQNDDPEGEYDDWGFLQDCIEKNQNIFIDYFSHDPEKPPVKIIIEFDPEGSIYAVHDEGLNDILSLQEAAELWGIHDRYLRNVIVGRYKSRRFEPDEYRKTGKNYIVKRSAMERVFGKPRKLQGAVNVKEAGRPSTGRKK